MKLKASDKAPKHWSQVRLAILSRIEEKTRSPSREEATIEEISCESTTEPREDLDPRPVKRRGRLDPGNRVPDIELTVEYNLLEERKVDRMIQEWKSYPGMSHIICQARQIIQNGDQTIENLVETMKGHESQQSAPIVASIATLLGQNISSKHVRLKQSISIELADMMLWDVRLVTSKET